MSDLSPELEALIEEIDALADDFESDLTDRLLEYTRHAHPQVRAAGARGLWEHHLKRSLEPLLDLAENDPDEDVRGTALSVLGRYIYEGLLLMEGKEELESDLEEADILRVRSYLEDYLYDAHRPLNLRRRALEALAFDPSNREIDQIESWSDSGVLELQVTSLFAMGRSGFERFKPTLLSRLSSDRPEIQREAIRACAEARIVDALPRLEQLANGSDRELGLEALSALGDIGTARAIEFLTGVLAQEEDEERAEVAGVALERAEEQLLLKEVEEGRAYPFDFDESEDVLN